jgi:hypothetical protein
MNLFGKKPVARREVLEGAIKRGGVTVMSLWFKPGVVLLSGGGSVDEPENPRTVGPILEPNAIEEMGRDAGKTLPPGPTWTLRHDEAERSGGEPTWGGSHAREECLEVARAFDKANHLPPPKISEIDLSGEFCVKTNFGSPP